MYSPDWGYFICFWVLPFCSFYSCRFLTKNEFKKGILVLFSMVILGFVLHTIGLVCVGTFQEERLGATATSL